MPIRSIAAHALVLALVAAPATRADNCDLPADVLEQRPGGQATDVALGVMLIALNSVREPEQVFEADIVVTTSWGDPRLAAASRGGSLEGCLLAPDQLWHPRLQVLNRRSVEVPLEEIEVDRDGRVLHRRRLIGQFGTAMDLRDFPFDSQTLSFELASFYGEDQIAFRPDEQRLRRLGERDLPGWEILAGSQTFAVTPLHLNDRAFAGATVAFSVRRGATFHVWKLIVPLTMIVFMAWCVFWLDPKNLGPQVGLSTSAALTFVAFQLGLRSMLPPIDYLTRADRFILGSQALVFLALAEAIAAARLAARGDDALAARLDRWSRVIYPLAFALVLVFAFRL